MPVLVANAPGSWARATDIQVKKDPDWARVNGGWVKTADGWVRFYAISVFDSFDRVGPDLGTASDGFSEWSVDRGSWSISSNAAATATSPSSYPMASVEVGLREVIASVDTPVPGSGVAFGVIDADNWFGAYVDKSSTTYACNPYACNPVCILYQQITDCNVCGTTPCPKPLLCEDVTDCNVCGETCGCTSYVAAFTVTRDNYQCVKVLDYYTWVYQSSSTNVCESCTCSPQSLGTCGPGNVGSVRAVRSCLYDTSNCFGQCGCINPFCYCNTCEVCTPQVCCATCNGSCLQYSYSTCFQQCTGTVWSIKVIQCVNGVISELATLTTGTPSSGFQPLSIKADTTGSTVVVTAFSGAGLTGSSASVSVSADPTGTRTGILVGPSSLDQGQIVDNFYTEVTE